MARDKEFRGRKSGRRYRSDIDSENDDAMKFAEENFNNITKRLAEAESFTSATKKYMKMVDKVIDTLRFCIAFLEVDVKTTEEAILESEREISYLKSEINSNCQSDHRRNHQPFSSPIVASNNGKESSMCCRAADKLGRNVSKEFLSSMKLQNPPTILLDQTESWKHERYENVPVLKSRINSEISYPNFPAKNLIPNSRNWKIKHAMPDSDFLVHSGENRTEDNTNVSRNNINGKLCLKHLSEIDPLSLRNIKLKDILADSISCEQYEDYTEDEVYSSNRKEYYSKLLKKNLKQKGCRFSAPKIDYLSPRLCKNYGMRRMFNIESFDESSTEELAELSTIDEFLEKSSYSSPNETKCIVSECVDNLKPQATLYNPRKRIEKRNKTMLTGRCTDSKFNNTEQIQLTQEYSDGKCIDQNIPFSFEEFSSSNDVQISLPRKRNFSNETIENWFDAIDSWRNITQKIENSESSNLLEENSWNSSISNSKMATSSPLDSGTFKNLCGNLQCSAEGATSSNSHLYDEWNGETLIIENSTQPYFKKVNRKLNFYGNSGKSQRNITQDELKKETSNYKSMNSSYSCNESTYFSFMRETSTDFKGENCVSVSSNVSSTYLDTSPEDTTDTSVHDSSSDDQKNEISSKLLCESLDISICKESSNIYQVESSDMSLTEVSSNASTYENSNSFQFYSGTSLDESACSSSFSKMFSCLNETDLPYVSFREGLQSASLYACNNDTSLDVSLEVNASRSSEDGKLITEARGETVLKNVSFQKCRSLEHIREQNEELGTFTCKSNEILNKCKTVSFETNAKKSRSLEILTNTRSNEMTKSLSFVGSENSVIHRAEITRCALEKASFCELGETASTKFYSESIRSLINDNHWIS